MNYHLIPKSIGQQIPGYRLLTTLFESNSFIQVNWFGATTFTRQTFFWINFSYQFCIGLDNQVGPIIHGINIVWDDWIVSAKAVSSICDVKLETEI